VYDWIRRNPYKVKNDELFMRARWYFEMPFKLDLRHPKRYNEKLQWLKLHDHNPLYSKMVDKYEAKKYVADIIGEEYIIPTLGVWNSVEEIDWDSLPSQFVLKCTHDSGGLVICKDKTQLDIEKAKTKIKRSLETDYFALGREWAYKNVPHRVIAEKYMEDTKTKELRDYKFFCFEGVVRALFVATDRQNRSEPYFDFFDENYNHLDLKHGHENAPTIPEKPLSFNKMKELAEKLSKGLIHVRVDFYEIDGKPYFGELTLYHHNGIVPFRPDEWDYTFGSWLKLPIDK
jgi:hypothetical protein